MFYLVGIFRVSNLGDRISSNTGRTVHEEAGGRVRLCRNLQPEASSQNIKILLLIKGNEISQVKEFSTFPGVYSRGTAGMSIRNASLFIEVRNLSTYEGQLRNVN